MEELKQLYWVNSALKGLKEFPEAVKDEIGYTLHCIQEGQKPSTTKHLKGLGSGVMEIVCDFDTNTYRAVYVLNLGNKIYVLHCFQKKSKRGITTP